MPGSELVADGLTKALCGQAFIRFKEALHLHPEKVSKAESFQSHLKKVSRTVVRSEPDFEVETQRLRKIAVIGGALMKIRPAVGFAVLAALHVLIRRHQRRAEVDRVEGEVIEDTPCIRMIRARRLGEKPEQPR